MSRSPESSREELEANPDAGLTFKEWAESRATLLVAVGMLVMLLAVLVVVSVLHPR
jgi:hypothetical protein